MNSLAATPISSGPAADMPPAATPQSLPPDLGKCRRPDRVRLSIARRGLIAWVAMFGLDGLYRLGCVVAFVEYLANIKRCGRYRRALKHELPVLQGAAREAAVRATFRRVRCDKWLYLIFDRLPRAELAKRTTVESEHLLTAALAAGHGTLAMLSHHGAHDLAAILMSLRGYRCAGIRIREDCAARRYMFRRIARVFPELAGLQITLTKRSPRQVYRWFEQNRVVGCAADILPPSAVRLRTAPVLLFGETRPFLTGPVQLAQRGGATIIQGFIVSEPGYRYRIVVYPVDATAACECVLQQYASRIEAFALEHPDHLTRV